MPGIKKNESPWICSKCGSRNVELRGTGLGIPVIDKLLDLVGGLSGGPKRQWGAKRIVCKDCRHVSIVHIM